MSSIDERLELLWQACDELQEQSEKQAKVNRRLRNELYRARRRNAELRKRLKEAGGEAVSIDLRQFEIEEREVERHERQFPPVRRPGDLLVMFDKRLCLRVGDHLVYVADVFGAIDNLVDHGWIDPRLDVEDELRRIHREAYKSGQLPERLN